MRSDVRLAWCTLCALPLTVSAIAILGSTHVASAQANEDALPSPLELEDAIRIARERHPEVAAAVAEARAAEARPAIVGSLSDPSVNVQLEHLPFPVMGADVQGMATQGFPLSRVLRYRRRSAEAQARGRRAEVARTELDIALEAARAFFMLYELRRMVEVVEEQRELARDVSQAASARYGAAQGFAGDVLRAESEAARLEAELVALRAGVRGAEAMLGAALARDPRLGIPELARPASIDEGRSAASVDRVVERALERRPELAAGRAAVERADAETRAMRSMYAPMAMLGAGGATTMAEGPGLMGMVGLTVPIYRARLRGGVSEARAMAAAARAELEAARLMVAGEAESARAEVAAAHARMVALRTEVVPRSREAVDATLASYAAAQLPLVSALDAAQSLWSAEVALIEAEVALGLAQVRLERAMGTMGVER